MREYQLLSRDEEIRLIERWQRTGDRSASTRLVLAHQGTVYWVAKRYRHFGVPAEELIAEGNLGILIALSKFQPDRGSRFITYAVHWIRAQILAYLIRADSMVSTGHSRLRSRLFFTLRQEHARLEGLHGPGRHAQELLARRLGTSRSAIASLLWQLDQRDVSLERTGVSRDSGAPLLDTVSCVPPNQEEQLATAEMREHVMRLAHAALSELNPRERYVLENRLMAEQDEAKTLAELARRLGISRERARQIEARAKRKLRERIGVDGF